MKMLQEEVKELLEKSRNDRISALDSIFAITRVYIPRELQSKFSDALYRLQNAEFSWGSYDSTLAIMRANNAGAIEDGRLIK